LIAACLAYIWIIYLGSLCEKEGWQKIIHRQDRCDLSLFQLGLRTLEYFLNEDFSIPVMFYIITGVLQSKSRRVLLEYLIAGRPIVVFAPPDSYHATSAQKGGWGYIVTEDSPQALAAAIQQVARNTTLAASLVQGALREAHIRRASHHANRLYEWVQRDAVHSYAHRSHA
jgi:glycosyltransferase involved in cell wall biosynthesis